MCQGTAKEIEWRVEDGKLVLIDPEATRVAQEKAAEAEAEEEEQDSEEEAGPVEINASLYPGKSWIGWISSNHGGSVEFPGSEEESEE